MRRARGINARRLSSLVPCHDVEQRLHRCADSSGCTASSSAAVQREHDASELVWVRVSPLPASSDSSAVSSGAPAFDQRRNDDGLAVTEREHERERADGVQALESTAASARAIEPE